MPVQVQVATSPGITFPEVDHPRPSDEPASIFEQRSARSATDRPAERRAVIGR